MQKWKIIPMTMSLAFGAAFFPGASGFAMPLGPAAGGGVLVSSLDETSPLIDVRYRRWRGAGAGFATGLIIGGAIASQPYYSGGYPYYRRAYPAYGPYAGDDPAIAYCMQRFQSYDPYSMTYLGFDGYRHPCP
jgi:hypothetical protein